MDFNGSGKDFTVYCTYIYTYVHVVCLYANISNEVVGQIFVLALSDFVVVVIVIAMHKYDRVYIFKPAA